MVEVCALLRGVAVREVSASFSTRSSVEGALGKWEPKPVHNTHNAGKVARATLLRQVYHIPKSHATTITYRATRYVIRGVTSCFKLHVFHMATSLNLNVLL